MNAAREGGRWTKAIGQLLALVTRPVRKSQGAHGTVIETYRGYGSRTEIFLIGRVFRQSHADPHARSDDLRAHLRDIGRRIRRRRVPGAVVTARFAGGEVTVTTDADGYFRINLHPQEAFRDDVAWHRVALTLDAEPPVHATAEVFVPTAHCRFVVISDIDDTVMHTGVANKLKMLWRLFVADAESRVAFPGAAALYRALHAGVGGNEANPMLYVSRAPWGVYDMLAVFFRLHGIPAGPVMFLREWGLSWRHPFPRRAEDHKRALIDHMLTLYSDRPFVLIGDSGQHDPEVYASIVEAYPSRVRAVYIRNVSRDPGRVAEIERLAEAVAAAGSSLVLAPDSTTIAEHAAGLGLIPSTALAEILDERAMASEPARSAAPLRIGEATAEGTGAAVADGTLRAVLSRDDESPPAVVVEGVDPRRATPP